MYVSSISDIAEPLCVRIEPGYYSFGPVHKRQGFKFGIANKTVINNEMIRVHSTRTYSAGLSNTFNGGEIRNKTLVKIICDNFLKNFPNDMLYYLFRQEAVVEAQVNYKNLYESFELIDQQLQQKYDNVDIDAYFRKHGFANYNNLPILLFLTTIVPEDHLIN
uniref:ORF18 n=1 Tax=Spilarctia obliqua nucleopolyhedrovirus TaxID=1638618 RepID=A0A7G9U8K2_9ABAC|nr:ORF18 [Spilarctia obliqua nucleopolyhedrovirus]